MVVKDRKEGRSANCQIMHASLKPESRPDRNARIAESVR